MKRFATFLTATSLTLATVTVAPAALAQNDPTYRAILGVGPDDTSVSILLALRLQGRRGRPPVETGHQGLHLSLIHI